MYYIIYPYNPNIHKQNYHRRGRRPRRPGPNVTIALHLIKEIVLYILDFISIYNLVLLGTSGAPSPTARNNNHINNSDKPPVPTLYTNI